IPRNLLAHVVEVDFVFSSLGNHGLGVLNMRVKIQYVSADRNQVLLVQFSCKFDKTRIEFQEIVEISHILVAAIAGAWIIRDQLTEYFTPPKSSYLKTTLETLSFVRFLLLWRYFLVEFLDRNSSSFLN